MANLPGSTVTQQKLEPAFYPQDLRTLSLRFAPNLTIVKGQVLGVITASGLLKAYTPGAADGSQTPRGLVAEYSFKTDANGLASFSDTSVGGYWGEKKETAPVIVGGWLKVADLVGADAAWLAAAGVVIPGVPGVPVKDVLHLH